MTSNEIRKRFLEFFEKREHEILPSASLVPENDPSVLFNTAGMQPLMPYLMGQPHPNGTRLADSQKCVRTNDLEEVGDKTHATFFEMLGNWSLGDYFKKEAINWSYEFLTSEEEGLGLDPDRLYITVFEGDDPSTGSTRSPQAGSGQGSVPKDTESFDIWKELVPESRIYYMDKESNWWTPGDNGPCGPDSEMFYDVSEKGLGEMTKEEFIQADDRQDVVEIWNDVFMQYEQKDGVVTGELPGKNVDTGSGLERIAMVVNGHKSIFETDLLLPVMEKIGQLADDYGVREQRIIADHVRTAVFLIGDGVVPSNKDQGYVLRRLIRRSVRFADTLGAEEGLLEKLVPVVVAIYKDHYTNLGASEDKIVEEVRKEEEKFRKTLKEGLKHFEKIADSDVTALEAFDLYQSYGFPIDLTKELASEKELEVDEEGFEKKLKEHQEKSRVGAKQKFKGGLADHSEMSVKYHTATHLLHQALRDVLGDDVYQKGSNITPERLRFDFSYGDKMTDDEKKKVERFVNEKIAEALPVLYEDISIEEARARGAIGLFEDNYGDTVRVYQVGEGDAKYSIEFCGGPHVKNTSELGYFKIKKEEACSAGIRRIKAVLE